MSCTHSLCEAALSPHVDAGRPLKPGRRPFVQLARTQLSAMAANAGLRLSFSSERSVADELARESYADVSTVRLLNSLHTA